jgi:hypothetical protein
LDCVASAGLIQWRHVRRLAGYRGHRDVARSFVNAERLSALRRLVDGDEPRFGGTAIAFHTPYQPGQETLGSGGLT